MRKKEKGHIQDYFEDKARTGDPSFAIAYALMELAEAQRDTAKALDRMGLNYGSSAGPPGALEKLAMETGSLVGAMDRIASALEGRD
jgi:hypothetical protein